MSTHTIVTPEEAADGSLSGISLTRTHTALTVEMREETVTSREGHAPIFADLNKYEATKHFIGQSTIFRVSRGSAKAETYCLAHHVTLNDGKRRLMVASLRYLDAFVKQDRVWLFAEQRLYVDWMEERALS